MSAALMTRRKALTQFSLLTVSLGSLAIPRATAATKGPLIISAPGVFLPPQLQKAFTQATGIELKTLAWTTAPEMVTKTLAGEQQFDLLSLTEDWVRPLLPSGKIQPIDLGRIPNYQHVLDFFKRQTLSVYDGKRYALPHFWGVDSIVYNKDKVKDVDSWSRLYDGTYAQRTAIRDDAGQGILIGALAMGGFADPTRLDKPSIAKIQNWLINKKPNIRALWSSFAQGVSLLTSGEVWALQGWMSMVPAAQKAQVNVGYARPREGALAWNHSYVVNRNARDLDAVYTFLNWVLGEEATTIVGKAANYPSASTAGLKNFSKEEQRLLGYDEVDRLMGTLYYRFPENLPDYIEAWSAFKNA
jgi:spermidine/putrescine transport system substrate-binding protein